MGKLTQGERLKAAAADRRAAEQARQEIRAHDESTGYRVPAQIRAAYERNVIIGVAGIVVVACFAACITAFSIGLGLTLARTMGLGG